MLMFTNLKISMMSTAEISHAGLKIFGIEVKLQDNIFAKKRRVGTCGELCYIVPNLVCTYVYGYDYCDGKMI